jgi:hypothetical protein
MLTYFIKYENRHQMRNTLAMVDPSSCQVTQVVANDVHLERTDSDYEESLLDEEDFIATQDEKSGKKLPVYFDDTVTSVRMISLL